MKAKSSNLNEVDINKIIEKDEQAQVNSEEHKQYNTVEYNNFQSRSTKTNGEIEEKTYQRIVKSKNSYLDKQENTMINLKKKDEDEDNDSTPEKNHKHLSKSDCRENDTNSPYPRDKIHTNYDFKSKAKASQSNTSNKHFIIVSDSNKKMNPNISSFDSSYDDSIDNNGTTLNNKIHILNIDDKYSKEIIPDLNNKSKLEKHRNIDKLITEERVLSLKQINSTANFHTSLNIHNQNSQSKNISTNNKIKDNVNKAGDVAIYSDKKISIDSIKRESHFSIKPKSSGYVPNSDQLDVQNNYYSSPSCNFDDNYVNNDEYNKDNYNFRIKITDRMKDFIKKDKTKLLFCYSFISFNNAIMFNIMLIIYYTDFHINYSSKNIENYYNKNKTKSNQTNSDAMTNYINDIGDNSTMRKISNEFYQNANNNTHDHNNHDFSLETHELIENNEITNFNDLKFLKNNSYKYYSIKNNSSTHNNNNNRFLAILDKQLLYLKHNSLLSNDTNKKFEIKINLNPSYVSPRSLSFNFTSIYFTIFILAIIKIIYNGKKAYSEENDPDFFNVSSFNTFTLITIFVSFMTIVFIYVVENLNTNSLGLLLFGCGIFSCQIFFSQLSLNELNRAAKILEIRNQIKIMSDVFYFTMSFRVLGMLFIYVLNNWGLKVIDDFVILPKIVNFFVILISCFMLCCGIFFMNRLQARNEEEESEMQ